MNSPYISTFKPRSLELIERVASGQIARLVLTKRGQPAVVLVPIQGQPAELCGALRELMEPVAEVDITAPVDEPWAARAWVTGCRTRRRPIPVTRWSAPRRAATFVYVVACWVMTDGTSGWPRPMPVR